MKGLERPDRHAAIPMRLGCSEFTARRHAILSSEVYFLISLPSGAMPGMSAGAFEAV